MVLKDKEIENYFSKNINILENVQIVFQDNRKFFDDKFKIKNFKNEFFLINKFGDTIFRENFFNENLVQNNLLKLKFALKKDYEEEFKSYFGN